jgi:hypothetical protein
LKRRALDELLLALCRGEQEEELIKLLEEEKCNVNYTDGAGNSAAHYAYVYNRKKSVSFI